VRKKRWTNQQREVCRLLVGESIQRVRRTGKMETTFLMVGDTRIRVRIDDVTDPEKHLAATKEIMQQYRVPE